MHCRNPTIDSSNLYSEETRCLSVKFRVLNLTLIATLINPLFEGDMRGMDKGYNDLQTRFYRLRTMIEDMRTNEQRLKGICRKYEERLINEQQRYKMLFDSTKHQLKM